MWGKNIRRCGTSGSVRIFNEDATSHVTPSSPVGAHQSFLPRLSVSERIHNRAVHVGPFILSVAKRTGSATRRKPMAVCLDRAVLNSIYIQNRPRAVKEIDAIVYFHMRNRPCCPILARKFSAGTHGLSVKRQTRIRYVQQLHVF